MNPKFDDPLPILIPIALAETSSALADDFKKWKPLMDPELVDLMEEGFKMSATDYVKATFKRQQYNEKVQAFFGKYQLLLTPTIAVPPFEVGIMGPAQIAGKPIAPFGWIPFTPAFNLTGQPAASVPCGWTEDGLPIGLQIAGRMHEDHMVLRAAYAFEQARPWANKKPEID